jgi:hypothetical protein
MQTYFISQSMYLRDNTLFRMLIYFFGLRTYLSGNQGVTHFFAHTDGIIYGDTSILRGSLK